MTEDLFSLELDERPEKGVRSVGSSYTAQDIEVLEGLEPVRRRPGMYIGGTDEAALHHLVTEVFDNAMDEVVAGYATRIEIEMATDGSVTIRDNGRGIPVDPHPKHPKRSALEIILTTLHAGGKFSSKVYATSSGLHGVGISVVNALCDRMRIEVVRDRTLWVQEYSRGLPVSKLKKEGAVSNRRGTSVTFHPDADIFGEKARFKPTRLYRFAKSKAYLFRNVEIRWACAPELLEGTDNGKVPEKETLHFTEGLADYLKDTLQNTPTVTSEPFIGDAELSEGMGKVEWAIHWPVYRDGYMLSYCNTVPTPQGGTHEWGFRNAVSKGLREYGEMVGNRKAAKITPDDLFNNASAILSLFYKEPQFQGQTKEKLASREASRLVEAAVRDRFDHWLSRNPETSNALLQYIVEKAEERLRRKSERETKRKTATQKLRLPGKLADCTSNTREGTELFLVEGDSAGGSAKQARQRETQAILPLRGKILNVASATADKIKANQELNDMLLALGCGTGASYREDDLRYDKIVIMTDADVDGAHIASLLMTYFYKQMPQLIEGGHLYLAQPPLYRLVQGNNSCYAADDKAKDKLLKEMSKGGKKVEVSRFKGLGEMTPPQLKETTMNPKTRVLLRVCIDEEERSRAASRVGQLMGKNPELRFRFIQEQTSIKGKEITQTLDI